MRAKRFWTIEEWIPPKNAIGGMGFWTELDDGRTEDLDEANGWLGKLMGQNRTVRLVEHTSRVLEECVIRPSEQ